MKLLSREEFREAVFARDGGKCVVCHARATAAHHLYDRKLWPDGGYYLENGVSLCDEHHFRAETTDATPTMLARIAARKWVTPPLPPQLDPSKHYDKWGNEIVDVESGVVALIPGPLWDDTVMRLLRDHSWFHYLVKISEDDVIVI